MKKKAFLNSIHVLIFLVISMMAHSQLIVMDGTFDDWNIPPVFTDNLDDGQNNGIDLENIWITNDQNNIYLRFETNKEINLQEDNELAVYFDLDSDINTGFKINGIGAEMRYFFGERFGVLSKNGQSEFINFIPIDLIVSPTVSSTQFEVKISRTFSEGGISITSGDEIRFRIEDNSFNGDEAPNDLGGISYTLDNNNVVDRSNFSLERPPSTNFRFLTYNIENDQLFDSFREEEFRRIFQAINPDIIAFQEIRDFSSFETRQKVASFLPGTWFHQKHGFDIVTISKYPIRFSESVDGNAVFFLDVDGQEVMLMNCHLPCCEQDLERQEEVDIIMEYIRDARDGKTDYPLEEDTPIIIAGDMNFVGDSNQPYTFLSGDIFNNGTHGPDFAPDWDGTSFLDANPLSTGTYTNFTWINPNGSFYPGKLDWVIYSDSRMKVENTFNIWTPAMTTNELTENQLNRFDELNASDHLPVVVDFSFGIVSADEIIEADIEVYPNPASTTLHFKADHTNFRKVHVVSANGQRMSDAQVDIASKTVNIDRLKAGVYFLVIETESGRVFRQFGKL